jgi:hypothetical protein
MRLTRSVLAGVVAGLALTACGSGRATIAGTPAGNPSGNVAAGATSAAPTGGSGGGSAKQPTCAVAPAAVVNAALGTDLGDPDETDNGIVTVCAYQGASAGHVTVRFQTQEDAGAFAQGRAGFDSNGEPTKDFPGLGDQAYSSSLGAGSSAIKTLVARKGAVEILVSSKASVDAEKTLVQQLFAKL